MHAAVTAISSMHSPVWPCSTSLMQFPLMPHLHFIWLPLDFHHFAFIQDSERSHQCRLRRDYISTSDTGLMTSTATAPFCLPSLASRTMPQSSQQVATL